MVTTNTKYNEVQLYATFHMTIYGMLLTGFKVRLQTIYFSEAMYFILWTAIKGGLKEDLRGFFASSYAPYWLML